MLLLDGQVHHDTHVIPMGNYVIGVGNYMIVSPSDLGNYVSADMHTHGYDYLFAETESGKRGVQRQSSPGPWPPCRPATPWCSGSLTGGAAQPPTC